MDGGTRLWLPPLALAGCVRGAMLRDTRGRDLSPAQRESFFPAVPLVNLSWWFEGQGEWLATPGFSTPSPGFRVQPVLVSGPFTLPTHTRASAAVCTLNLLLLPDAFAALTGIDPGRLLNQVVDARGVLPADWLLWADTLKAMPSADARLDAIEAFLRARWQGELAKRPLGRRHTEWAEALAVRAATSAAGRSVRQIERRVKAWAGLPMREIRAVSRAERAFLAAAGAAIDPAGTAAAVTPASAPRSPHAPAKPQGVNWADIAAQTDYADQSHLCRETRRITGFSPDQLLHLIRSEEAFWCYRLWR